MKLPLLDARCEPYAVNLTTAGCVARFEAAQSEQRRRGQGDWRRRIDLAHCVGCPAGRERAARLRAVEGPVPAVAAPPAPEPAPAIVEPASVLARRRRRGAPAPSPADANALAWRIRVQAAPRDRREQLIATVLNSAHGASTTQRAQVRAALLRRVFELSVPEVIAELARVDGVSLDLPSAYVAIDRGAALIARACLQLDLFPDPEFDAVREHLIACMSAGRADAGVPRPARRGPRKPRSAPAAAEPPLELSEAS